MEAGRGSSRRGVLRGAVVGALGAGLTAAVGSERALAVPSVEAEGTAAKGIQVAVLLYDGFTALDAVGPYEVLLPTTTVTRTGVSDVCSDTGRAE